MFKKKFQKILKWKANNSGTQSSDHQSQLYVADLCHRPSAAGEAPWWTWEALCWITLKILHWRTLIHSCGTQRHHGVARPFFTLTAKDCKASATKTSCADLSETFMITFFNLVAESPLFCSPSSGREGALRTYCTYSQSERGHQQRLQTAPSPFFLKQHWSRGTSFSESVEIQMVSKVKDVLIGVDREKRLDVLLSQSQKKFPQSNTFAWDSS